MSSKSVEDAPAERQKQFIRKARELLMPTPVTLNKIPGWLYKALVAARKAGKIQGGRGENAFGLLSLATTGGNCGVASWLDHWGTTLRQDVDAFVSEPHNLEGLHEARSFADMLGIEMTYSANSWWYPGFTFRISFYPKREPGV